MIFSHRCVLIRICTWILNNHLNWNFVFRTIWICDNNSCIFVTFCCCVNRCLVFELSTFWKVTDVADGILSVWLITWFNRLIFSSWIVLIRICTWVFNDYLNWNFVFRTVWVCYDNCRVFVTFCCCVNRCLVLELSAFWKVTNVANGILSVWLIAWFNRLILRCWCVLIRICTRVYNFDSDWHFINWTIWVSHNDGCSFIARSCCIHWSLEFELSSFWKITNIADWILCFWCFTNINRLVLRCWCVLICICTRVYNFNWYRNFVLRSIWISHNDGCSFISRSCCIQWSLKFKFSSFWKITNIANWVLSIWCFTNVNRLILRCWCVLIGVCTWINHFNCYREFIDWTIWVGHYNCCSFIARCCCIHWSLEFKLRTTWKVTYIANWILSFWCLTNINSLVLRYWCVLIGVCTRIYNLDSDWNFINWTIWISHNDGCSFISRCCCIHWSLKFKFSSFWKITNIANWFLSIWCFTNVNSLVLRSWRVFVCVSTWIYHFNCYRDFILRSIWVSHNDSCSFIAWCCCIHWSLKFKFSSFWKITNIANWVLSIWCFTNVNRLVLRRWRILICVRTWINYSNLNWDFVLRAIWVSHNDGCSFISRSCCIHWSLVFELSAFWKISNVSDWFLRIWSFANINSLFLRCWCVLICISTWICNSYLNWNLILRTIWVCHNNYSVFFAFCCCVNWCLVFKACAAW